MSSISSNEAAILPAGYRSRERVLIAGALALVVCRLISVRHSVAAMVLATLILAAVFTCYVRDWPWGRRWAFRFALPWAVLGNASALAIGVLVTLLAESGLLVDGLLGTYMEWNRAFLFVPLAGFLNLLALARPAARWLRIAAWLANAVLAVYAGWYWIKHESFEGFGGAPPFGADLVAALAAASLMTLAWDNVPHDASANRPRLRGVVVFALTLAMVVAWMPAFFTVMRRCRLEYSITSLGGVISDRSRRIAPLRIRELAPLRPYVTEIEAIYIPKNALTPANCELFAQALGNLTSVYEIAAAQVPKGCSTLLNRLPPSSRLEYVTLSGPGITDETLADLGRCARLTSPSLAGAKISNDGLRHLSGLRSLRTLVLRGTPISGGGMEHLTSLPGLTWLDLADTSIGDEDLRHLTKLAALISLDLRGTRVTADGVQQLQRALPRCQIDWGPSK
jgi:hypothetical protein